MNHCNGKTQSFYERKVVQHPADGSFSADGELARWSNKDLDPVPRAQKKWEWCHIAGFSIVDGFTSSHVQPGSANVALGLGPRLIFVAYLIGNIIVAVPGDRPGRACGREPGRQGATGDCANGVVLHFPVDEEREGFPIGVL